MSYLYEMHMHTSGGSACSRSTGAEQARMYKKLGYDGIFVTDHFFHGNTAVPRDLPWEERINRFCSGYEDAKAEGDRIGLQVFFGWEQNFAGDEYLIYGLDKQFMLAHPEMENWTRRQQLDVVHRHGGCVIQAHPFRDRDYIRKVLVCPNYADGIEVVNSGNLPWNDVCALRFAKENDLVCIAGSDNHSHLWAEENKSILSGIVLDHPLSSSQDLVRMILRKEKIGLHYNPDRLILPPNPPQKESYYLDENEQPYPTNRCWLTE